MSTPSSSSWRLSQASRDRLPCRHHESNTKPIRNRYDERGRQNTKKKHRRETNDCADQRRNRASSPVDWRGIGADLGVARSGSKGTMLIKWGMTLRRRGIASSTDRHVGQVVGLWCGTGCQWKRPQWISPCRWSYMWQLLESISDVACYDRTAGVDPTRIPFFSLSLSGQQAAAGEEHLTEWIAWSRRRQELPPRSSHPRRWNGSCASGCWTSSSPSPSGSARSSPSATCAGTPHAAPSYKV
jgi:hypothetical protein